MKGERSIVASVHRLIERGGSYLDRQLISSVDRDFIFQLICKSAMEEDAREKEHGTQEGETNKMKRRMIKRISECARPKIWCPQEDYYLPENGISVSIESAFPNPTNEKSKIAIYHSTEVAREDDGSFVLQPLETIVIDAKCHSTMPSDSMDDIELKNIQLQFPALRYLSRDDGSVREERVETDKGSLLIAVQGNRAKPAILTYHDLGLNYISSFQAFFNYIDMRVLLENFCVYHVNAPGQEEGAPTLPEDYTYPSMEELAEQLLFILGHFGIKSVIGFGVGAGANILARFALAHPEKVNALCLINCVSTQAGWIEWGYQKLNVRHLRSQGMTQGVLDYLMWHHFGRGTEERNHDLVQVYKNYFERRVNPTNLALFIDSYVRRTDLNITRELDPTRKKEGLTLSVPVMNITGALSPHVDDTVTLNGRLDPTNSSWMKISDCGMVLEEQPGKVSEAFRLFLQGEGYVAPLSPLKMADYRLASLEGLNHICSKKIDWPTATIHITENPISEAVVC